MRAPKILAVASAVDLDFRYGCTPAWWQLWKGFAVAGADLIVTPYRGRAIDSPWWRIREAAQYARCGPKVIYNAVRAGRLRAVRLGGRRELRIRRDWVDAWLERSEVTGEEAV